MAPLDQLLEWLSGTHKVPLIPPSFDGSRISFAWVLFGITITLALSFAAFVTSARNAWLQRHISRWRDPINVNRYIVWLFTAVIWIGAAPDMLTLLAYGEVSQTTLNFILEFDRFCDGLIMFPAVTAFMLWFRAKPVINYQLIRQPIPVDMWPTWRQMLPTFRIAAIAAFIALGVAIGK